MSEIIIPERLTVRLSHDKTWDSCVTKLKENIEPLLAKDPDFFPDYTIHGIDHINRCLDIADHLIDFDTLSEDPKKTDLLTPRDVAFLVCGILLHDMGMFLRPDGVRKLVQMDRTDDAFGGKPWKDEWSDYVDRTKRLSQEKMRYHFGKVIPVTEDCVNHTDTDDNKRIIGEFLRQHHARLAHEFALGMLPGTADTDLFEKITLSQKARDLIGILARSHGMAIRDTELYVKKHIGEGAKPYNTPVFYLMTVLRTADALDADERRAPEALERQQKINVPISVEEWTWNQCIDPDACDWRKAQKNRYIEANPKSSPQYVQLDQWLKGIQADLDLCWSILAEKYPYDRYRLSIHRVVSNIHEPGIRETMNEKFLTKEAKITANPEIVKLMMEPLYGNDPTYGVRELLQNAVDACVEREQWEKNHGNPNYKGLVDIRIENGTFTITDNGMGMNEDVLLNYYLSAGASYRSSNAWMAANAPDGKSRVARTGKFGVGFLASFLLGDEVEVHTQHRNDQKGYHFFFDQDSNPLDVKRLVRKDPGTTITIKLKQGIYSKLQEDVTWYNWYAFDVPEVHCYLDGTERYPFGVRLKRDPKENTDWHAASPGRFASLQWSMPPKRIAPEFLCNGIRIRSFFWNDLDIGMNLNVPNISVLDPDAVLDVDVSRSKIRSFPEERELVNELYRMMIAQLLSTDWSTTFCLRHHLTMGFENHHKLHDDSIPYLLSPEGFTLNHRSVTTAMGIRKYLALVYQSFDPDSVIEKAYLFTPSDVPIMIVHAYDDIQKESLEPWIDKQCNRPFENFCNTFLGVAPSAYALGYRASANMIWVPDHQAEYIERFLRTPSYREMPLFFRSVRKWQDISVDSTSEDQIMIDEAAFSQTCFVTAAAIPIPEDAKKSRSNVHFSQLLTELLTPAPRYPHQDMWIPFDMEERKKKFPKAFEELAVYMDHVRKYPVE